MFVERNSSVGTFRNTFMNCINTWGLRIRKGHKARPILNTHMVVTEPGLHSSVLSTPFPRDAVERQGPQTESQGRA